MILALLSFIVVGILSFNFVFNSNNVNDLSIDQKEITQKFEEQLIPVIDKEKIALFTNEADCKILGLWTDEAYSSIKIYESKANCDSFNPYFSLIKNIKPMPFDEKSLNVFQNLEMASKVNYMIENQNMVVEIKRLNILTASSDGKMVKKDLGGFHIKTKNDYIGYFLRLDNQPKNNLSSKYEHIQGFWYQHYSYR